jgi:hypothetical protein
MVSLRVFETNRSWPDEGTTPESWKSWGSPTSGRAPSDHDSRATPLLTPARKFNVNIYNYKQCSNFPLGLFWVTPWGPRYPLWVNANLWRGEHSDKRRRKLPPPPCQGGPTHNACLSWEGAVWRTLRASDTWRSNSLIVWAQRIAKWKGETM